MFSLMLRNLASVQLRCLQAIKANAIGIPIPQETDAAITWLQTALQQHWNGTLYLSLMPPPPGYDANIDIVSACIYGAVPCTDTKLLATAAQIRDQHPSGAARPTLDYPILTFAGARLE
jgi:glucoamylase